MKNNKQSEVYSNIERKRELVDRLNALLEDQMDAAATLDKKAWDIFSVTSATFGIVSAIEITQKTVSSGIWFWLLLAGVLFLYLWQIREVLVVVAPMTWHKIPGGAEGRLSFETLLKKYVASDESLYLDKLIVDFAGKNDPENNEKVLPGAIQVAQENNAKKAKHIQRAARLLGGIVAGLIIMALVATF